MKETCRAFMLKDKLRLVHVIASPTYASYGMCVIGLIRGMVKSSHRLVSRGLPVFLTLMHEELLILRVAEAIFQVVLLN